MNLPLSEFGTVFFCDETKFSIKNGDVEDAIYYFAVVIPKNSIPNTSKEFHEILKRHGVKTSTFHSTSIFRSRVRRQLMVDISDLIIGQKLPCFCVKYEKSSMLEPTKKLSFLNNDIIDFNNSEFQALFYFITTLNLYLKNPSSLQFKPEILLFFDRNVYGTCEIEEFKFSDKEFIFHKMTFVNKSEISLLALVDFLGFIFRKSKISQNKVDSGEKSLEISQLAINSYSCMLKINESKLFKFISTDERTIKEAIMEISRANR